jgi:hypothetical protein
MRNTTKVVFVFGLLIFVQCSTVYQPEPVFVRSPGIDSASLCTVAVAWRAGTSNRVDAYRRSWLGIDSWAP